MEKNCKTCKYIGGPTSACNGCLASGEHKNWEPQTSMDIWKKEPLIDHTKTPFGNLIYCLTGWNDALSEGNQGDADDWLNHVRRSLDVYLDWEDAQETAQEQASMDIWKEAPSLSTHYDPAKEEFFMFNGWCWYQWRDNRWGNYVQHGAEWLLRLIKHPQATAAASQDKPQEWGGEGMKTYRYTIEMDGERAPINGQTYLNFPALTVEQQNEVEEFAIGLAKSAQAEQLVYETEAAKADRELGKELKVYPAAEQDKPQEWNVEGLPPVGYTHLQVETPIGWLYGEFTVVAHVILIDEDGAEWNAAILCDDKGIAKPFSVSELKPIKSQAEKEREEFALEMCKDSGMFGYGENLTAQDAREIYDWLKSTGRLDTKGDV